MGAELSTRAAPQIEGRETITVVPADAVAEPVVTVVSVPSRDCVGVYTTCDTQCVKTYVVVQTALPGSDSTGAACEAATGDTAACQPDDSSSDDCDASDVQSNVGDEAPTTTSSVISLAPASFIVAATVCFTN
eukprot:SAG11_NODE_1202_length_5536_cov_4.442707_2_plen_133_part_00